MALRIAAWFCVALLAFLALVPGDFQIRTPAPGLLEHVVAYLGTAILFALSYPDMRYRIAALLIAYGGVLEAMQSFSPGRHPTELDASASALGVILGISLGAILVTRPQQEPGASDGGERTY